MEGPSCGCFDDVIDGQRLPYSSSRATSLSEPSRSLPRRRSRTALCRNGLDSERATRSGTHSRFHPRFLDSPLPPSSTQHQRHLGLQHDLRGTHERRRKANEYTVTTRSEGTGGRLVSTSKQLAPLRSDTHSDLFSYRWCLPRHQPTSLAWFYGDDVTGGGELSGR